MTPEDLERDGAGQCRALILNSPSNPTGAVYTRAELEDLAEFCRGHEFFILTDEIYEDLVYTEEGHVSLVQVAPDLRHRIVRITGLSKSYAMTGWRVGFGLADKAHHRRHDPAAEPLHVEHLHHRAEGVPGGLRLPGPGRGHAPGVPAPARPARGRACRTCRASSFDVPDGAFYLMLDCRELCGPSVDEDGCWRLATYLLEKQKLATIPGKPFGAPGCLRLSFASSEEQLREAVIRLRQGLQAFPG